jgi:hypothetical protein
MSQEEETDQTNSGIEIALPDLGRCREEYGSEKEKEGAGTTSCRYRNSPYRSVSGFVLERMKFPAQGHSSASTQL